MDSSVYISQLGPTDSPKATDISYAIIRRHQTADFGVVPNPVQPNVFMATAVDLTDHSSPYGS